MSKFFVGQRVRIVGCWNAPLSPSDRRDWERLRGAEGVVYRSVDVNEYDMDGVGVRVAGDWRNWMREVIDEVRDA